MEKSIISESYGRFRRLIRQARKQAGMTQKQLADALGETQTFVSKCERGERRLDIIEARMFCAALGVPFQSFVEQLESVLSGDLATQKNYQGSRKGASYGKAA